MLLNKLLGCSLTLLISLGSMAKAHGLESCENPNNPNDLIQCALIQHPEIQRQDLKIARDQSLKKLAGQRPNPEFSYETTFGEPEADTSMEGEIFLSYPFELGGKRKARIQKALAQKGVTDSRLRLIQEKIVLVTVLSLYRLKQISTEVEQINEALETFRKIEGQYKARGILTPHQEVSLNIYQLASQDYEIRKTSLIQEKNALLNQLKKATSLNANLIMRCLPKGSPTWPKINQSTALNPAHVKVAEQERHLATSEKSLADSKAWPNFNVGPLIKYEQSQDLGFGYGLGLSLPLPLINRNQGGKAVAEKSERLATRTLELSKQESRWNYEEMLRTYRMAVGRLQSSPDLNKLENRHHRLHEHFFRGLVETSLVVETHRQLLDLTRDRNQLELEALSALWSLYALEGRILEEKV